MEEDKQTAKTGKATEVAGLNERLVMREQPEKTYIGGHGIGRAGCPKEWTSTAAEPTNEDWDRWRNKAMQHCRWKKMVDLVFENNRWVWITGAQRSILNRRGARSH